jgi:hypothetical protein
VTTAGSRGGHHGRFDLDLSACEVHNIGVNWPHHVFVNQDFKVVGAE